MLALHPPPSFTRSPGRSWHCRVTCGITGALDTRLSHAGADIVHAGHSTRGAMQLRQSIGTMLSSNIISQENWFLICIQTIFIGALRILDGLPEPPMECSPLGPMV